ncbi:MAG: metal-dependent hydrolase [Halobacteriaceae archaeon]
MYRTGHYGVALLTYAPVGFGLLIAGYSELAVGAGALVLLLTPVPDYDLRVPLLIHRGFTHTVAFAFLVAVVLGGVGWQLRGLAGAAVGFGIGLLAIGAHILADILTPAGVKPFWPLSGRGYSIHLTRADSTFWNYLLLALGVFVTVGGLLVLDPLGLGPA